MNKHRHRNTSGSRKNNGIRSSKGSHDAPPFLDFADEMIRVRDFEVAVCRISEFDPDEGITADFRLIAIAEGYWYQVCDRTDLAGARRIAERLERPTDRTHQLCLVQETRTVSMTPAIFQLTGRASMVASFLRVHWAPEESAFEIGAEYDAPLDARHPRRVKQADLDADRRRFHALVPYWQPRMADAYELLDEVYGLDGDGDEPGAKPSPL